MWFYNIASSSRTTDDALTDIVAEPAKIIQVTSNQIVQSTITFEILEFLRLKKDKYFSLVSILFNAEGTVNSDDIQVAFGKRLEEINCFRKTLTILRYFLDVLTVLPKTSGTFTLSGFAHFYSFAILCW